MSKDFSRKISIAAGLVVVAAGIVAGFLYYSQPAEKELELDTWDNSGFKHPVYINHPEGLPLVDSGKRAQDGSIISVRCNTCHENKDSNRETNSGSQLQEFHQKMQFNHGSLSCVSCHNSENYETLHLADGKSLEFRDTMQLCAQCHGPQYRDYRNGSHGGMSGYWDLNRGSRKRNTCTDCHSAHVPAYPKVLPVFPPKIRAGSKLPSAEH
jgi:cytochrome c553